jgi:glycosyltransferase involved in cell wall biosynthesis
MSRIALVTNVFSHYRIQCFATIYRTLSSDEMTFYFLSGEMAHRGYVMASGTPPFSAVWLDGCKWHRPPYDDRHLNDIRPILRGNYDVTILGAWDEPTYLLLWLWGVFKNKKVLFWIESTAYEGSRKGIRESYKRLLLKYAEGCIVPGKRSFEYCARLGMDEKRIFIAPNATDREYFRGQADKLLPSRQTIRKDLSIEGVALLYVGRFVEEYKNVSILIEAFGKFVQTGMNIALLLVGDGPDRYTYEKIIREHRITGVCFLGQMDHNQLCRVYAASDIQILTSRSEPWGFVLNEGMEFGLPLIVSEAVGAGPDLVHEGVNGFFFPTGDVDALADKLEILIQNEALRKKMGEASRKIIEDFSPENWAKGVKKAIEKITGEK